MQKPQATIRLLTQLAEGEKSGQETGWLAIKEVREHLGVQKVQKRAH